MLDEILNLIPQRPPFLFIDKIISKEKDIIKASKTFDDEEYFFKGHFPDFKVVPGVILLETIFQAGSLLVAVPGLKDTHTGVVTRVNKTKFKKLVRPLDPLDIRVELDEQIEDAYYLKGEIKVFNTIVCQTHFACTLIDNEFRK